MSNDDQIHYYTYTSDDNESTVGKQENIPAMDYTSYTQEEEDNKDSFITINLYHQGLPDLIPRNRNPDRVPPNQLEAPCIFAASSATEAEETICKAETCVCAII